MLFRTKRELLEYLGKNLNDNKLVDRMISRGDVIKDCNGYEYVDREEGKNTLIQLNKRVKELEDIIKGLEDTVEEQRKKMGELAIEAIAGSSSSTSSVEYEELKANYEYLEDKFQRLKKGYNIVIDYTYEYIKRYYKIDKSEFKEQLSEAINDELWRDE